MQKKFHFIVPFMFVFSLVMPAAQATDLVAPDRKSSGWDLSDTAWESAYLLSHIADWGQTRDIASQCGSGNYKEMNPVLGSCPSMSRVNTYFISTALLHAGVSAMLPRKYRRFFQTSTMIMEIGYVTNNYNIGLKFNF